MRFVDGLKDTLAQSGHACVLQSKLSVQIFFMSSIGTFFSADADAVLSGAMACYFLACKMLSTSLSVCNNLARRKGLASVMSNRPVVEDSER